MIKTPEELGLHTGLFKDDTGRYLTQSLFLESSFRDTSSIIYTLKNYDHEYKGKPLPSIKKIYLELEDPTEYSIATMYFDGWDHWNRILGNKFLRNEVDGWRNELDIKLRSKAITEIIKESTSGSRGALSAAKWLADRGWSERKAGAPSKEEKEGIIKQIRIANSEIEDDFQRIQEPLKIL